MFTSIPFIVSGEIISVIPFDKNIVRDVVRYNCRAKMPNGQIIPLTNVTATGLFGGIDDFFQIRSRATKDVSFDSNEALKDSGAYATIGDRVLIAFINGSLDNARIIAYDQHPKQVTTITDANELDPQLNFRYLGFDIKIDETGQATISHNGAPEISFKPSGDNIPSLGDNDLLGPSNPAVKRPESSGRTVWEMLDKGVFRVRDSIGQVIELNNQENQIIITNNNLKSTEKNSDSLGVSDDSEYIVLDDSEGSVTINATNLVSITSLGDREDKVIGNFTTTVAGNITQTVLGDITTKTEGDSKHEILGDYTVLAAENVKMVGNLSFSGITESGAGFKVQGGQVAIGSKSVELLDLLDKTLDELDKITVAIAALTVPTLLGNSGIPVNVAEFVISNGVLKAIKTKLATIKLGGL